MLDAGYQHAFGLTSGTALHPGEEKFHDQLNLLENVRGGQEGCMKRPGQWLKRCVMGYPFRG
ncbi:hypothetical protein N7486_007391 [Penicillium sp. IBT 16267x]|nr:hypothetical protein N7486_007391 [Penicillium sp. IBT 16267x]